MGDNLNRESIEIEKNHTQENSNESIENKNIQGNYYSGAPRYFYHEDSEKEKRQQEEGVKEFRIFGPISLIYSLIFVLCLYKNFAGITNVLWTAATVYYMVYITEKLEKQWRKINTFLSTAIILLGISNFTTGNSSIIFLNYVGIVCLIATNMIFLFLNTKGINVTKHLSLLVQSTFGSIGQYGAPFGEMSMFLKEYKTKKHGNTVYVFIGIVVAIPVLVVIGNILASADEVFREVFSEIGELLSIDSIFANIIGIAIMFVIGYVVPYAFCKYIKSGKIIVKEGKSGTNEPIIAIIVTGAVSLLYVLFSGIQIIYLFLGNGTLPADYSYAEYAREGFFQLLFVSAFNVIMVLICIEFFRENKILKGILMVISICTFIMIASSAYRMSMYIGEYGLTFTRVFVLWTLVVITLVMTGLLYQLLRAEFNMFKYSVVMVTVCFLILSFSHLDYFIAKYDLNMYEQMREEQVFDEEWHDYVDYEYLMRLSTDATPAIMEHKDEIFEYMDSEYINLNDVEWAYQYYEEYGEEYNKITIRNFNVSRYVARLSVR